MRAVNKSPHYQHPCWNLIGEPRNNWHFWDKQVNPDCACDIREGVRMSAQSSTQGSDPGSPSARMLRAMASVLGVVTLAMGAGIFAATMGL